MLFCLILATIFIQSFGQSMNCSSNVGGTGWNASLIQIVSRATVNGYPYPYSWYSSIYNNGTTVYYQQIVGDNPRYKGSVTANISQSSNDNFDCVQTATMENGNILPNGTRTCSAYSIIPFGANAFAYIGCYNYYGGPCPSACTTQYILGQNHTFFGQFFLNTVTDAKKNPKKSTSKQRARANVNCSSVMGYNASTIVYDAYGVTSGVGYASIFNNGSYRAYSYNDTYYANATYTIQESTSSDIECEIIVNYQYGNVFPKVQCLSYSLAMNGTARVGCSSTNATCPTSCDPQFVTTRGNFWFASFGLNYIG